ncbi:MAG: hypothetical protein SO081_07095 [Oscillospiraceae bacterium]|nr:hypothetical protein [Oscillospiraceae bacterium]
MTYEEIIQALRQCTKRDCSSCGMCPIFQDRECVEHLAAAAASLIERLTAETAALREKAPLTEDTMINLAAQVLGVEPSRLREIAEADKDGRCVVLPCKGYSSIDIARDGVSYRPDHWNIYLTAHAHGQNTTSGLQVGLFDIGEVERALQEMEGKKDGNETNM